MKEENLKYLVEYMYFRKGLYGLFSNTGFGKTTFMMHLIHELSERGKKCLLFSLELSEKQVIDKMKRLKLRTDKLKVLDDHICNSERIEEIIELEQPQFVFIDYIQLVDGRTCDLIMDLKRITKRFFSTDIFYRTASKSIRRS